MTQSLRAHMRTLLTRVFASASIRFLGIAMASLVLAFAPQTAGAHEYKIGDLEIGHPWSRATPAGAKVASGYLVINNHGTTPDRLVSITSEIAGTTEVHEMAVNAEGVMTMRPIAQGVEIPAGGEVVLKPGGFHIMFMGLKQPPKEGVNFKGTLTFEKAGRVDVEFAVEAMGGGGEHDGHTN